MAEAIQTAYRSSPPEVQTKIRRVVEVWRTRNVFEAPILEAIEARIDEIDKSKGSSGKKTLMGKSLFTSSSSPGMPKELETLAPLQIAVTKETISARPAIDAAQTEYTKLNDPSVALPSPPVHAARLSSLIKSLAAAESALSASIKARKSLIADLERILEINKSALEKDEETYLQLESRKASTEAKKREVEDGIIRGLSSAESSTENASGSGGPSGEGVMHSPGFDNGGNAADASAFLSERPEIEELTPEREMGPDDFTTEGFYQSEQPSQSPPASDRPNNPAVAAALANFSGTDYSSLAGMFSGAGGGGASYGGYSPSAPRVRSASNSGGVNGMSAKRRKTSHGEDEQVPDLGEMGMEGFGQSETAVEDLDVHSLHQHQQHEDLLRNLDADVDELLRQEGGGGGGL